MARLYLFTLLFAGTFSSLSAFQNIDSLRNITRSASPKDTSYILALSELAYQLYSTKSDSSLMLAKHADSLALKIKFDKGEGRAKRVIGIYYWSKANFEEAMQYFDRALHLAENSKDQKGVASCLANIGVIYRNQGNIRLAADYFFRSLKIREAIHDRQGIATTTNNLGLVYRGQHLYDKALESFKYSIEVTKAINDMPGMARAFLNIGSVYQTLHRYSEALDSYNQSLNLAEKVGDRRGITFAYNNLADVYVITKQYDLALDNLTKGLRIAAELGLKDRIADLKKGFASYYNATGDALKAYQFAKESEELSRSVGVLETWRNAAEQKYLAAKKLGRYQEALNDYSLYIKLSDSIKNEEITKAALSEEYDFKSQKLRADQEKKELEHQAIEEKHKRTRDMFAGIAFTFVIISILIFISNRKINHQKKELQSARALIEQQNEEISKRNTSLEEEVGKRTYKLAEYNQQLEQFAFMSAHNLRAPVARILGLGNLLGISLGDAKERDLIAGKIVSTTYELDEVVREINGILQAQKEQTSVITRLTISDEFQKIKSILYKEIADVRPEIIEDFSRVNEVYSVGNYFQSIFLNLFSNALKFRDPNRKLRILISTEVFQDNVVFHFSDTGIGMDLSRYADKLFRLYSRFHFHAEGKGIGLYLVKTQLASIEGKIEVESKEGIGTTFRVYLKSVKAT